MIRKDKDDEERKAAERARARRKAGAGTTVAALGAAVTLTVIPLASHDYPVQHGPAASPQSLTHSLGSLSGDLPPHPEMPGYWMGEERYNNSGTAATVRVTSAP